jgi:hypothetical protein
MFSADYPYSPMAQARNFLDQLPVSPVDKNKIAHGNAERLHRNTDKAKMFMIADLPITNIAEKYVIFAPLNKVKPYE